MYNFFNSQKDGDRFYISGADFNHIKNVLRMKKGERILISCEGKSHLCELESLEFETAVAKIIESDYNDTSLPIKIYLFQALPKSEKMELIIQKAVELGAEGVIPVETGRCVVRLDDKKKKSKVVRWQSISESAAKQSKRNIIPQIFEVCSYKKMLNAVKQLDLFLVPYECKEGMSATKNALLKIKKGMSIGILIGCEGGFEESEIKALQQEGAHIISLGKRILRTETAAITAMGMCMLYAEMGEIDG